MNHELVKIKKARRVPPQREVIRAARGVLWESVGRIDVGTRENEAREDTWDATYWAEDSDLSDLWPLKDFLKDARNGGARSVRVSDLYVYSTDEFTGLISNLSMVRFRDDWFLTEENYVLDWDRYYELYKKGELNNG